MTFGRAVVTVIIGVAFLLLVVSQSSTVVSEIVTSSAAELTVAAAPIESVSAQNFTVLDVESGTEIMSRESDLVVPIASITKLVSAALLRTETNLLGSSTITWADVAHEGRAGKLEAGQTYSYRDLVIAMLLESSNDAAAAVVREQPGLLLAMNTFVADTGFGTIAFADTSGLSDRNQGSSYEVAQLLRALHFDQPYLFDLTRLEQFIGSKTGWVNNSPFVSHPDYRGGKHGFTYEANRTAAVLFAETISGEERLIAYVVLGSDDLGADIEQLRAHVGKHVSYR